MTNRFFRPDQSFIIHSPKSCPSKSGHTRPFEGRIGQDLQPTIFKQLPIDMLEVAIIPLTFPQMAIGNGQHGQVATIVTPGTTTFICLLGTNSLGVLQNNGTMLLAAGASAVLQDTKIVNYGSFTDQAALVTCVECEAVRDMIALEDRQILAGETVQREASTLVDAVYTLTFTWEVEQVDGSRIQAGSSHTYTPSRSGLRVLGSVIQDQLAVVPLPTTRYRCIIKIEVGNVVSTLTSSVATVTVERHVATETLEKEVHLMVQNGILSVEVDVPANLLIVRFDGQVVRRICATAGKT